MNINDSSDQALLAAHLAGSPYAFSDLIRRHQNRLWSVALRTIGEPEEAADALQDALLSAFRSAGSFRGDAAVTTWLHRIVVNACLDRLRRRTAKPAMMPITISGAQNPSRGQVGEPIDKTDAIVAKETAITIHQALQQLSPEQRAAIVLVDIEGYGVAETAAILNVAEGTVKSRCARGREKLASLLTELRNPSDMPRVPSSSKSMPDNPHSVSEHPQRETA